MTSPSAPTGRPATVPARTERLVLVFVLVTLLTLLTVPILVNRRVASLRQQVQASEPARTLVNRLQFNLVREMGALTEYLLTGDDESSERYARARQEEEALYRELEPLVERLGPEVAARFQEVREQAQRWHGRATNERLFLDSASAPDETVVPRERLLFEELIDANGTLDAAIFRTTNVIRDRISEAERGGLALTFVLGLLALIAGIAANALAARARRFALESERRRVEAIAALQETARVTEARERLVRGVTHDLKNPLGAAKGYAEILAMGVRTPLQPEQAPMVEGVMRSIDSALSIIADLLDVARVDGGGLSVERIELDLSRLVSEVVGEQRIAVEKEGHTLSFRAAEVPIRVRTDPARVRQVLQNLLSNAVKYTPPPGQITLATAVEDNAGAVRPGAWAVVRVSDTGPGIPPADRERIFDEFYRLNDRSGATGHGLGLAIARRVARLLGGELVVEDVDAPGATFALSLPIRRDDLPG